MNIIKGEFINSDSRIAIVISRFNEFINKNLLDGAVDILDRVGKIKKENITIVWVPGAYEIPLTINMLLKINKYEAIIALGTVIKGSTSHFQFIAGACSSNLSSISINHSIPISFGILTTENIEQAIERSGSKLGNKGSEAALVALEMISILKKIKNIT